MIDILRLLDTAHDSHQQAFLGNFFAEANQEVWEKDGITYIELEVPGVKAEDVDISAQDSVLKISWKRKIRGSEEKSYKQYRLSKDVDLENVQAKVQDGLLTVELHRSPRAAPKKIPVIGPELAVKKLGE